MRTGQRDLEVQARNEALQLERIEQQMGRLRVVHENSIEESRKLFADLQTLRRWLVAMSVVIAALFSGHRRDGGFPDHPSLIIAHGPALWALLMLRKQMFARRTLVFVNAKLCRVHEAFLLPVV